MAVKAPGFGDNRKNTLRDMAVASGGVVFGDDADLYKIEDVQIQDLGQVSYILFYTNLNSNMLNCDTFCTKNYNSITPISRVMARLRTANM